MRAMIIDKFEICRIGFKVALEENFEDSVICEASSIKEALSCLEDHGSDIVVFSIDEKFDVKDSAFVRMQELGFNIPIIVVGNASSKAYVDTILRYNIKGFLDRSNSKEIMIAAIKLLLAGGRYFPPEVHSLGINGAEQPKFGDNSGRTADELLTKRQREILSAVSEGKSNKVIGVELGISAGTVKIHVSNLMKNLQARNRTQAVSIAKNMEIL
ncbi:MAG: response regulator transcription factor [Sneathiella sp.]